MGRSKKFGLSAADIQRRCEMGRGMGHGIEYQPWIFVGDFASKGEGDILIGHRHKRQHHCLSKIESRMLRVLEYTQSVLDVREQFPIPLAESIAIAAELGMAHPSAQRHKTMVTLDFLIDVAPRANSPSNVVRSCKYAKDLQSGRARERLQLEKAICERRGWTWQLFTERELSTVVDENLRYLSTYWALGNGASSQDERLPLLTASLLRTDPHDILQQRLEIVARKHRWSLGDTQTLFQIAGWHDLIPLDLHSPIELDRPHLALRSRNSMEGSNARAQA